MHEERNPRADVLIVDDPLCPERDEERPVRILVVGAGNFGRVSTALAALQRDRPGLPQIIVVQAESESAPEWQQEAEPLAHFPFRPLQAPEESVMFYHMTSIMASILFDQRSYGFPRPRRAKRNKQTNKKKNFRRR